MNKDLIAEIEKDPFHDDILKIKNFTKTVAKILMNTTGSTVYSIEAPFGAGKTIFTHRLKSYIKKDFSETHTCIRYSASEDDLHENPFFSIIYRLQEGANPSNSGLVNNLKKGFLAFIGGLSVNGKVDVGFAKGEIGWNGKDAIETKTKRDSPFENYAQLEILKTAFKTSLENLCSDKKIILIIDELDRCRPDYALKTLEVIKHFFDVEGLTFLLSINGKQIEASAKQLYGITAELYDSYIRKFIDFSLSLPEPKDHNFIKYLYEKSDIEKILKEIKVTTFAGNFNERKLLPKKEVIIKNFELGAGIEGFGLRKQEQVFKKLKILLKSFDQKEIFFPELYVPLLCIYECNKGLFSEIKKNNHSNLMDAVFNKRKRKRKRPEEIESNGWIPSSKKTENLIPFTELCKLIGSKEQTLFARIHGIHPPFKEAGYAFEKIEFISRILSATEKENEEIKKRLNFDMATLT